MNRELKFRAWYEQTWVYFSLNEGFTDDGFKIYREIVLSGGKLYQYTGLTDKNGKEIYEGDIVKSETYEIQSKIVEWFYTNWEPFQYYMSDVEEDFEVIGNIYENPELIKTAAKCVNLVGVKSG